MARGKTSRAGSGATGAQTLLPVALDTFWQVRRELAVDLRPSGLTIPQYLALVHLAESRHEVGMRELAQWGRHDAATMTAMIDGLVRRGWVARRRSASDRRKVSVRLTARGRRVYQTATRRLIVRWRQALKGFGSAEQLSLLNLLVRLIEGLQSP